MISAQYVIDYETGQPTGIRMTDASTTPPLVRDVPLDANNETYKELMALHESGTLTIAAAPATDFKPWLKQHLDKRIDDSVTSDGITVKNDARTRQGLLIKSAGGSPNSSKWAAENGIISVTPAQVKKLIEALDAWTQKCFDAYAHILAVHQATPFNNWDDMRAAFDQELGV